MEISHPLWYDIGISIKGTNNMQLKDNAKTKFFLFTVITLALLVALGRLNSYFNTLSATDVAISDWVTTLLTYLGEVLTACRTVVSFSAIAVAAYLFDRRTLVLSTVYVFAFAFLDCAARFVIDFVTGAITGVETMAVIWLLLQFAYEAIFIILAVLIVNMMKAKLDNAENPRKAAKYSPIRAVRWSLFAVCLSRVALEVYYLIDFLLTYTNITNTEIASIIGQFLKIIVIYGGISFILAEAAQSIYAKLIMLPAPQNDDE